MKGFVIMTDVIFATLLIFTGTLIAFQNIEASQSDVWSPDFLHRMGTDVLRMAEIDGLVDSVPALPEVGGEALILVFLEQTLPPNIGATITFNVYTDIDGDDVYEPRVLNPTYETTYPPTWTSEQYIVAKGMYAKFNETIPLLNEVGVVEIKLWTLVS